MTNFIISGLYTLTITLISGFIGYLMGSKDIKKVVDAEISKKTQPRASQSQTSTNSGAIKQVPDNRTDQAKDFDRRIKELGL